MKHWFEKRKGIIARALLIGAFAVVVCGLAYSFTPDTSFAQESGEMDGVSGTGRPSQGQVSGGTKANTAEIGCGNFLECSIVNLFARIAYIVLTIFAILLGIAGVLLNWTLELTIIRFDDFVNNVSGIKVAWEILRDVLNVTFIFILLYTGIKMILGAGGTQKILTSVIVAGLLINFSFFFTKVAIDLSNVLTIELHEAVEKIGERYEGSFGEVTQYFVPGGISGALMQGLSPTALFKQAVESDTSGSFTSTLLYQMVFGSVLLLITAVVLLAMCALLIIRFVMLIILLITSPIIVMRGLLPQLDSFAKRWTSELVSQLAFAPVLMLFIIITVLVAGSTEFANTVSGTPLPNTGPGIGNAVFGFVGGSVASLLMYLVTIGLLIAGIVISKSFSGEFGKGVTGWAEKTARGIATAPGRWTGGAARYVGGAAGGAAARQIGTGARWAGGKYDLAAAKLRNAANTSLTPSAGANRLTRAGAWASRGVLGAVGGAADRGLRSTLKSTEDASVLGSETLAAREKYDRQRRGQLNQAVRDEEARLAIEEGLATTTAAIEANDGTYSSENDPNDADAVGSQVSRFISEVGKLSNSKIEEMLESDLEKLTNADFAGALTSRQMETIMKADSAKISDVDKEKIRSARNNGLARRMNMHQVGGAWVPRATAAGGPGAIDIAEAQKLISQSPEMAAQIPIDILTHPDISVLLTPRALAKLANDDKVDAAKLALIKNNVTTTYSTSPGITKLKDWFTTNPVGKSI